MEQVEHEISAEEQIIVKSEMDMNGEFLVLYVDDVQQQEEVNAEQTSIDDQNSGRWTDEETKRLLVFYIDNKETFLNGQASKKQLWTIACKTMLIGKTSASCEMKLRNLKRNYSMLRIDQAKGKSVFVWPYYDLCHQAFHDDTYVNMLFTDALKQNDTTTEAQSNFVGAAPMKVTSEKRNNEKKIDEKVEQMLHLYLKFKRLHVDLRKRQIWEKVAQELGEDAEYWHKRFLNFKQHYIVSLEKRRESGPSSVNWPYMHIFDEIYEGDLDFQAKFGKISADKSADHRERTTSNIKVQPQQFLEWDDTEKTVLVKYYFDCFDEFQDPTIPNSFLWHEIGRLLDKKPEECKKKYEAMKSAHIDDYVAGNYDIRTRIPVAILFDNIIAKEVQMEFVKYSSGGELEKFTVEEIDGLVQFFYDNLEMFKDPICHFVCWAAVSRSLSRSIHSCKAQWDDLTSLYKSILEDKKEDTEIEVDWRYIELFERIFDYGLDTKLLEGYECNIIANNSNQKTDGEAQTKKLNLKMDEDVLELDEIDDDDDKGVTKRSLGKGDEKSFKILEYYLRNKDRFSTKKKGLWDALAKQIGISAEQCAHRFRNLKQVYTTYIQREIYKPEVPILWPYYFLCKKVFGYRQIKNKLKNASSQSDESDEWTPRDIKKIINHFARKFNEIDNNIENTELWRECAQDINKSVNSCRDKFLELRKSYRKVKTVMNNNPDCKVNWKYYKLFDEIYSGNNVESMEVDTDDSMDASDPARNEINEDDDYQCIIVLPEGQEMPTHDAISEIPNAQIIITDNSNVMPKENKTRRTIWKLVDKKRLLQEYLKYIKSHEGKIINTKDMWREIAKAYPNKSHKSCHNMYLKLKTVHNKRKDEKAYKKSKIYQLFQQISSVKTKFYRPPFNVPENVLKDPNLCENVELLEWKVELALKYYLDNLEEFILPNYSTEYVWKEFGKMICIPLRKLVKKINYLKNFYNSETNEIDGQQVPYGDLIKQILEKELQLRMNMTTAPVPSNSEELEETTWSDEDVHDLLVWYLANLQRFKNPKYIKSYLWMEAANVVGKSAVSCSEKMSEIRTQYSSMVKETPQVLASWKFFDLCQKIYGTGKKTATAKNEFTETFSAVANTDIVPDDTEIVSEAIIDESSGTVAEVLTNVFSGEVSIEVLDGTNEVMEASETTINEDSEAITNAVSEIMET